MKKPKIPFLFEKLGVSYAISAVIMTASVITLVLVASSYAYQFLEQQRGAAEFDVAVKSILSFDDALENIAWKPLASRSARFTVDYGQLELLPNLPLMVNVTDYPNASYSDSTGYIRYRTKIKYVNFEEGYQSYFLGSGSTISSGAGSYGRASIEQNLGWVNIPLTYGVRAMKTSTTNVTQDGEPMRIDIVDIWIIRINITNWSINIGDFDLKAKCLSVTTKSWGGSYGYPVPYPNYQCNITVQLGNNPPDTASIELDGNKVVFNFVIATVRVSV